MISARRFIDRRIALRSVERHAARLITAENSIRFTTDLDRSLQPQGWPLLRQPARAARVIAVPLVRTSTGTSPGLSPRWTTDDGGLKDPWIRPVKRSAKRRWQGSLVERNSDAIGHRSSPGCGEPRGHRRRSARISSVEPPPIEDQGGPDHRRPAREHSQIKSSRASSDPDQIHL